MIVADYIILILILGMALVGVLIGFGKSLKLLTKGIVGILISIVNCYFLFGLVIHIGFVEAFMNLIIQGLRNASNWFCDFLLFIHIEMITVGVLLFILIMVVKKIIVVLISKAVESDHIILKVINKTLGAFLGVAVVVIVGLIVMQITYAIKGTEIAFLQNSFFGLDKIYLNNPMAKIIDRLKEVI